MSDLLRSPKGKTGVAVAAGLLLIVATWLLLIAPQRSKAAELSSQVDASRTELSERKNALLHPSSPVTVKPSDLYRLTKALPNETEMSGVVLEVSRLAGKQQLGLSSISPAPPVLGVGFVQQPLAVVVQGRFAKISSFLRELRQLVVVRGGRLDARGRLYGVSKVDMSAPDGGNSFPIVKATVTLNTYSFSPQPPAATTDQTPTTDTSSSGTVAAGATP